MDATAEKRRPNGQGKKYQYGTRPNVLRAWLEKTPRPMTKTALAAAVGVTPSYISQLCADNPPWPKRHIARRIGEVTQGAVTPNHLAGYRPPEKP